MRPIKNRVTELEQIGRWFGEREIHDMGNKSKADKNRSKLVLSHQEPEDIQSGMVCFKIYFCFYKMKQRNLQYLFYLS